MMHNWSNDDNWSKRAALHLLFFFPSTLNPLLSDLVLTFPSFSLYLLSCLFTLHSVLLVSFFAREIMTMRRPLLRPDHDSTFTLQTMIRKKDEKEREKGEQIAATVPILWAELKESNFYWFLETALHSGLTHSTFLRYILNSDFNSLPLSLFHRLFFSLSLFTETGSLREEKMEMKERVESASPARHHFTFYR